MSSRSTGSISTGPVPETDPACTSSTAGLVSEGLNAVSTELHAAAAASPAEPAEVDRPRDVKRLAAIRLDLDHPGRERSLRGPRRSASGHRDRSAPLGRRAATAWLGTILNASDSEAPTATASRLSRRRRVDTLWSTSVCLERQRGPDQRPKPSEVGDAAISAAALAPRSSSPRALRRERSGLECDAHSRPAGSSGPRRRGQAVPGQAAQPLRRLLLRRRSCRSRRRTAESRPAVSPESEVASPTPGAVRSGLSLPSKANPRDENEATPRAGAPGRREPDRARCRRRSRRFCAASKRQARGPGRHSDDRHAERARDRQRPGG